MTLKQIDKELDKLNSISDKLDYLKNFHLKIKRTKTNHRGNKIIAPFSIYDLAKKMRKAHFPELDNNVEFSLWFLKYNAQEYLKSYLAKIEFERKINSNRREKFIENELNKLDKEISKSNQMELANEISSSIRYRGSTDKHSSSNSKLYLFDKKYYYIEVLRMQEGNYYMHHITEHSFTTSESPEVIVYALHVLYKNQLFELLNNNDKPADKNINALNLEKKNRKKVSNEISMMQVALIYSYNGNRINYDNMHKIALEYGFDSPSSGNRLYQLYNSVHITTDRKGSRGSLRKDQNRINDIKKILPHLKNQSIREKAEKEIQSLKNHTY